METKVIMDFERGHRRNWLYIVFFAGAAMLLWILYTWRMVLLPFMIGLVLAYIMTPMVRWLERIIPGKKISAGAKRTLAIFLLLFLIMGVLAFAMFILITDLLHSSGQILANSGQYINNFIARAKEWTTGLRGMFPENVRAYADQMVQSIANSATNTLQRSTSVSINILTSTMGVVLGFAAVPLFLFYLLKDSELAVNAICSIFGKEAKPHLYKVLCVVESVLGRYIRAGIILSTVLFCLTLAGLLIIGIHPLFAFPLAFIYGLGELVPTFGAWFAGAIMFLVVLAVQPDKLVAVLLMDLLVKLLENMLLVPRIQASTMRIHPTVIIVLLVLGAHFWGLWGMIFTVPIAATLIDVFKYVRTIGRIGNSESHANQVVADKPS
jgi:predicted PurR-regulated permease PerM